jgi:hypothetical protein
MTKRADPGMVAAAAGTAIHFAMLPENEAAFVAYLNSSQLADPAHPVTAVMVRRMMSAVHDQIAPDCDVPIEVL